jgi:hypothetical protein
MLYSSSQERSALVTATGILGVVMEEKQRMLLKIKRINYSVIIVRNHTYPRDLFEGFLVILLEVEEVVLAMLFGLRLLLFHI